MNMRKMLQEKRILLELWFEIWKNGPRGLPRVSLLQNKKFGTRPTLDRNIQLLRDLEFIKPKTRVGVEAVYEVNWKMWYPDKGGTYTHYFDEARGVYIPFLEERKEKEGTFA